MDAKNGITSVVNWHILFIGRGWLQQEGAEG